MANVSSSRWVKRVVLFTTVATLTSVLTGCSSTHGLEPLAARDRVEAADGVRNATVTTGTDQQTLKTTHFVDVRLQLDGTSSPAQLSRLIDYAIQVGWATDIGHSPTDVQVSVSSPAAVDTLAIVKKLGLEATPASTDHSSVLIGAQTLEAKWGRWPGPIPRRLK